MTANPVLWTLDERGVATVTLNRPEVSNAYDGALISGVLAAMDDLGRKPNLRVVVLRGNGKHFQAGADLKWINSVRPQSAEANEAASRATFEAVQRLNTLPIPTVALVQGGCFGGGTGVIAACDVVIAADNALFSITEVRWGLTAAIIIPQLCDAVSVRQVRRYALTGERFGADVADCVVRQLERLERAVGAAEPNRELLREKGPEGVAVARELEGEERVAQRQQVSHEEEHIPAERRALPRLTLGAVSLVGLREHSHLGRHLAFLWEEEAPEPVRNVRLPLEPQHQ